jgi:hypothetical protein
MTRAAAAAGVGAVVIAAGALVAGGTVADVTPEESITFVGPGTSELQPGQYVGPCSIVTPPAADPCDAAQLVLRYQFWGAMVNADWFKKWKKGAPGDWKRLCIPGAKNPDPPAGDGLIPCIGGQMSAPVCSTFTNPQPQIMVTRFGEALSNEVEAYACALGTEPISLPVPDPAPTGTDKTAPSAPQNLETVPSGPTG